MSYFNRNKWVAVAFLLLIALNLATLTAFWLIRDRRPGPPSPEQSGVVDFLSKELNFDSLQKQKLVTLNREHQQKMHEIRRGNREAKDAFFTLLQQHDVADSTLTKAAHEATRFDEETDILTFRHFQQVRNLCTEEQKKKFDNIIQQVLRMNGPPGNLPGPPPRRNDGREDGPPPPGERDGPPPPPQQ